MHITSAVYRKRVQIVRLIFYHLFELNSDLYRYEYFSNKQEELAGNCW